VISASGLDLDFHDCEVNIRQSSAMLDVDRALLKRLYGEVVDLREEVAVLKSRINVHLAIGGHDHDI